MKNAPEGEFRVTESHLSVFMELSSRGCFGSRQSLGRGKTKDGYQPYADIPASSDRRAAIAVLGSQAMTVCSKSLSGHLHPMWRRYISGLCPAGMFLHGSSA